MTHLADRILAERKRLVLEFFERSGFPPVVVGGDCLITGNQIARATEVPEKLEALERHIATIEAIPANKFDRWSADLDRRRQEDREFSDAFEQARLRRLLGR